MAEYITLTVAILGGGMIGWPYLVQTLNALDAYFQSLYYVIQSPLP